MYNVHCNILSNHKLLISDILIKNIITITNSINRTRKQLPVYRKYTSRILEIIYISILNLYYSIIYKSILIMLYLA